MLSRKNAVSGIVSIRRAARLPSGGAAIALATLLALTAKVFLVDLAVVDGHSMEPSFSRGSIVLVVRCAYGIRLPGSLGLYWFRWSEPCPGDVVLAFPKASGKRVIKRVMAVGPEAKGWNGPGDCLKKELLPEEIFLLGDNPEESRDSREYGPVRMGDIAGRVVRLRL